MAVHEASDLSAVRTEFRATLDALGIAQRRIARLFGVGARSVRRWQDGDRRIPRGVGIVLRLLATEVVTIAQAEQAAAVAISARTNGSATSGAPAPLLVAPAPPARADPGLTTAEKVCALAAGACRWPYGDPARPDFHFCGCPVARRPYCEFHHAAAYRAPLTGSGRGAPIGLVTHGWRSPTTKRLSTGVSTRASTDPVGSVDRSVDESIAAQAQDFRAL
jgi:GcrA cell cycle regulator